MIKCGELNCDHQCEDGIIYCACHQHEMKDCIAKQVEEAYARGVKERVEGQREIIENFKQQHGLMSEAEWVKYHSDKLITDIRDGRTKLYTEEQKQQAVEKAQKEWETEKWPKCTGCGGEQVHAVLCEACADSHDVEIVEKANKKGEADNKVMMFIPRCGSSYEQKRYLYGHKKDA